MQSSHCSALWRATALLIATSTVGTVISTVAGESKSKSKALVSLPQSVPAPLDNPTTPEKVALGKQLFFDPRLSGDNKMSCATCHLPEKAFGDL